jgi:DNA-directed RNA polymerase specialized sigma24 family protein
MAPSDDSIDSGDIAGLVERACGGDEEAWQRLWRRLDAPLSAMVRGFHMGRVSHEEDERRAVVLEVMARLREADFRRLKMFVEARSKDERLALLPWIKVVARRVAIDHLRAHPNYVAGDRTDGGGRSPGQWHDPKSLPPASLLPGVSPAMTRDGTAHEMLAHARQVLPDLHYHTLALKVQGHEPEAIAAQLGLASVAEVDRIVRAALERLRRKFRTSATGDGS